MKTRKCSWADFISEANRKSASQSEPLFRGARNHKWKLSTTLERIERIERKEDTLIQYFRAITIAKRALECCFHKSWEIPDELTQDDLKPETLFTGLYSLPAQEYMIYLRHHGFPSPLLDWSQSPYVASFFAFAEAKEEDEHCSIYRYVEFGEDGKGEASRGDDPKILTIGPCIATHKRHFMQQSQYTYCVKQINYDLQFFPHEEAINLPMQHGDEIIKYILPISERQNVLQELRKMNISAYTLFGSEDSLIQTLAHDEYLLS